MAESAAVRRIGLPRADVWTAVADHQRLARLGPGLTVTMERDGEHDPGGVGAIRRITGPAGVDIREQITGFVPGRRLAYRALSGIPLRDWTGAIDLVEHRGDTVIRWQLRIAATFPGADLLLHTAATAMLTSLLRTL